MIFFNKNKKDDTDEELLAKYRDTSDAEYFGQLYNRYIPLIYGVCLKYLQNEDRAQDAVMEIFEYLQPRIGGYEIKVFRTWLYSVVKNHCFHVLKENKRELAVDFDSNLMESDAVLTLFSEETGDERENALNRCIELLPEPQRIAVHKFFFEDMSYAEIVDSTGYQLKSVKSYIQNGKRNLKNCIENSMQER
ncbi:RNA polymerase sigma-70 factor (ECF subfamily) [Dysgonomonas sp. PH5-45]|uniref:RNA polymerase sigma factor n=1 Tax=unclassified Dysgonomonas TaxID=2630389 RepID=UPI002475FAB5|nr:MULTISPECIES: sigma-70 family RNA polymerase sigma factor [unclassified Dysgonomonas]MDH6354349.1 RNA polymerase sigma-70 factor (ECF subfamily) [Dysgonomonas sp. PH5-45]